MTGVACLRIALALSPASVLMIDRRSMFAVEYRPFLPSSTAYPYPIPILSLSYPYPIPTPGPWPTSTKMSSYSSQSFESVRSFHGRHHHIFAGGVGGVCANVSRCRTKSLGRVAAALALALAQDVASEVRRR